MRFTSSTKAVNMQLKQWALRGPRMKNEQRFIDSFDFQLNGELNVLGKGPLSTVLAEGFVDYSVAAERPSILEAAPSFILDGTVGIIKDSIRDFVNRQFSAKFLQAYSKYSPSLLHIDKNDRDYDGAMFAKDSLAWSPDETLSIYLSSDVR
jgi:hypothetical protein